jgi:hypothetical protein
MAKVQLIALFIMVEPVLGRRCFGGAREVSSTRRSVWSPQLVWRLNTNEHRCQKLSEKGSSNAPTLNSTGVRRDKWVEKHPFHDL